MLHGVRKYSNEQVTDVYTTEFDKTVQGLRETARCLARILRQVKQNPSLNEVQACFVGWRLGLASQWGQQCIQQGYPRIVNYPSKSVGLVRDAASGLSSVAELEDKLHALHDSETQATQELGYRSLTYSVMQSVDEAANEEDRLRALGRWADALEALFKHGAQDAYEVRMF